MIYKEKKDFVLFYEVKWLFVSVTFLVYQIPATMITLQSKSAGVAAAYIPKSGS
jgi:hypothetical protein